ncbi:hypothetical protein KUTeg_011867 [Tegillarca granosa]|uniref:C2H2-type domain-containing protein n=1 Tax=Tegillarca granosa TaxID=220873 RepID=A0ABQ9F295_TEGGR|nr:hypothetical protein KUTeg_011867 [Tegillarca granosa]
MWKCAVCSVFVAVTLRLLIAHIYMKHSQNPGFMCRCNVDGCPRIYTKWNSYYRHVHRELAQLLDQHDNHNVEQENNDLNADDIINYDLSTDAVADGPEINENDDVVEENRQNTVQKQRVLKYIMNLKEMHKIRETCAEFIAIQTNAIVKQHMETLKGKLFGLLQSLNIIHTDLEFIDELLEEELPFDGLITAYQRNKFIRSSFRVVEAEVISVGQAPHISRRMGKHQMQREDITFSYIPMIQSIQQFLQNEQISDCVFQKPLFSPLGFMCDLVNGTIFKHHDLFVEKNNALRIVLYYDDLEICNPLSKQAGTHKIGVFYYLLATLPISYRSRLPAIRILSIIKRNVLDRIKTDLDSLSHGVEMNINGRNQIVKGAAIAFVGDTLASHEFCGFKIGVGFSFQKCRECECTYDDMQTKFHERFFTARY